MKATTAVEGSIQNEALAKRVGMQGRLNKLHCAKSFLPGALCMTLLRKAAGRSTLPARTLGRGDG